MPASANLNVSVSIDDLVNEVNSADTSKVGENGRRRSSSTLDNSRTTPKKIRKKSEPKIIENMKEHSDNDTLSQLTTTTLRYWLKQQQVHCTTREKKADLMEKVQKHLLKNEV